MQNIDNSENNINNYGERADFASFIVPEGEDFCEIQVSWEEAEDFGEAEITEDEMRALGLIEE